MLLPAKPISSTSAVSACRSIGCWPCSPLIRFGKIPLGPMPRPKAACCAFVIVLGAGAAGGLIGDHPVPSVGGSSDLIVPLEELKTLLRCGRDRVHRRPFVPRGRAPSCRRARSFPSLAGALVHLQLRAHPLLAVERDARAAWLGAAKVVRRAACHWPPGCALDDRFHESCHCHNGGFIWAFGFLYRSRCAHKMSGVRRSWQRGGGRLNCRSEMRIRRS